MPDSGKIKRQAICIIKLQQACRDYKEKLKIADRRFDELVDNYARLHDRYVLLCGAIDYLPPILRWIVKRYIKEYTGKDL